jgi:hypothetical protein
VVQSPTRAGRRGYTASIVGRVVEKLAGLVIVVACCWWAASVERSRAADNWLLLAESHLTRRLFGSIVRRIDALAVATG